MAFYNTIGLVGGELKEAWNKANDQEHLVLHLLNKYGEMTIDRMHYVLVNRKLPKNKLLNHSIRTESEYKQFMKFWNSPGIISLRRAADTLLEKGLSVRSGKKKGALGKMVSKLKINA